MTLDDGTRIWVNSESYIRFPVVFHGDERRIWVSGEVFLEVTKDLNVLLLLTRKNWILRF